MRIIIIITALTLLASALPAAADWQFTKWGMTVDQVQKASKGALQRCDAACDSRSLSRSKALLQGTHVAGDLRFTVFAGFGSDGRLNQVTAELDDPSRTGELGKALTSRYGEPIERDRDSLGWSSTWQNDKDRVWLFVIGSRAASIRYEPTRTATSKGL